MSPTDDDSDEFLEAETLPSTKGAALQIPGQWDMAEAGAIPSLLQHAHTLPSQRPRRSINIATNPGTAFMDPSAMAAAAVAAFQGRSPASASLSTSPVDPFHSLPARPTRRQSIMRHPTADADPMEIVRQLAVKRRREQEERARLQELQDMEAAEAAAADDSSPSDSLLETPALEPSLSSAVRHVKSFSEPVPPILAPTISITVDSDHEDFPDVPTANAISSSSRASPLDRHRRSLSHPPLPPPKSPAELTPFPAPTRTRRSATNEMLTPSFTAVQRQLLGIKLDNSDAASINLDLDEATSNTIPSAHAADPDSAHPTAPPMQVRDVETGEWISIADIEHADHIALDMIAKSSGGTEHLARVTAAPTDGPIHGTFLVKGNSETHAEKVSKPKGLFSKFRRKKSNHDTTLAHTTGMMRTDYGTVLGSPLGSENRSRSTTVSSAGSDPSSSQFIKMRVRGKRHARLTHLRMAQVLSVSMDESIRTSDAADQPPTNDDPHAAEYIKGSTWALQFSRCGRYVAAGGQDYCVRVWCLSSAESDGCRALEAGGVFAQKPMRKWIGHTSDVLNIAWSKNNFLVSASMDKTARLWHITRDDCIFAFDHTDYVTSVAFHPKNDRFFLSGSLDGRIRLWSVPDKVIVYWEEIPSLCTAVGFVMDGKLIAAGTVNGLCHLYETDSLKYRTQITVRSTRGRGRKITGIQAMPGTTTGQEKVLITSNDSRIRLYTLKDLSMEWKYKGHVNESTQIGASFSSDGRYVVSGSEDGHIFLWDTVENEEAASGGKQGWMQHERNPPCEFFEAYTTMVPAVAMAPETTKRTLFPQLDELALDTIEIIASADNNGSVRIFINDSAFAGSHTTADNGRIVPRGTEYMRSTTFIEMTQESDVGSGVLASIREDDDNWDKGSHMSRTSIVSTNTRAGDDDLLSRWDAKIYCPSCDGDEFRRYEIEGTLQTIAICNRIDVALGNRKHKDVGKDKYHQLPNMTPSSNDARDDKEGIGAVQEMVLEDFRQQPF